MPLAPFTGVLGKKNAAHLLRRATFGGTKADIDSISGLTASQAIQQLFVTTTDPLPPIDPVTGITWVNTLPVSGDSEDGDLQGFFMRWWLGMLAGAGIEPSQKLAFLTREKIVFLLHTHFTTIQETVNNSRALYFQNALFRKFAFDNQPDPLWNFKMLTKKVSMDNAMMVLLDGRLNVKGRPNENYAREFLELFTIGKGLPGYVPPSTIPGDYIYFTEQDVQAAARVFSGYDTDFTFLTIDEDTQLPRVKVKATGTVATQHDNDPKVFSDRFGNTVITPDSTLLFGDKATEASMLDELDQLIEMIYAQQETVKNICRRIYRFYVYHEITQAIDNGIIADMANTFVANNFKLQPVIMELLQSQHFYDSATPTVDDNNFGALIKSPLDLVLNTLRFFEYNLPDPQTEAEKFYETAGKILDSMKLQGMNFLNPYDVAGYDAYFQYPLYNRNWISANTLTQRYKFIFDNIRVDKMEEGEIEMDILLFIQQRFASVALNPDDLIKELASYLLPMSQAETEITVERLNYFKSQFFVIGKGLPQGPEVFWEFSWNNANTIPESKDDARGMLQYLLNAMLQSPEYQLF
ncbi:MAG: DUF1800 family protein [Sporocytophaga sp.]|uniref:DUF1800 domain-containing protein n=1 Tax=Sporocytophaga sp. TaxID=2231183 RepID=UPI001B1D6D35|nr:DUF1800 family protein [Sporocytophaga sp.]MBO9702187.1 DUF1800 family protein [Sporocytophaga sp.]